MVVKRLVIAGMLLQSLARECAKDHLEHGQAVSPDRHGQRARKVDVVAPASAFRAEDGCRVLEGTVPWARTG